MLVSILLFGLGAQKVHFRSELFTGIRFWEATVRLTIFTWLYSRVTGNLKNPRIIKGRPFGVGLECRTQTSPERNTLL